MTVDLHSSRWFLALGVSLFMAGSVHAALPSVQDALALQPIQKDVQVDRPEAADIAKCTIKAESKRGLIVRDANGQILRSFSDTNGDGTVDQWSYFKDGVEVYRDMDTNANKRADQCRWLNTAGSRWGLDANEDGKIDAWKNISPEEVTAELVAAIRDKDRARFERVMLSEAELKTLGLGQAKNGVVEKKIEAALAGFAKLASSQSAITAESKWASFGGTQPGVVPAGTEESTADITVYENVMAMVETAGKEQPLSMTVGTLIRVKDNWRVIDLPTLSESAAEPLFFTAPRTDRQDNSLAGQPSEKVRELMDILHKIGDITPQSTAEEHEKRIATLKLLAEESDTPENRSQWQRQLADTLSAAVQTGGYDAGVAQLKELYDSLKEDPKSEELAAYVQFRHMTAEHGAELAAPNPPFETIQKKWIGNLEKFVEGGKKFPDSAEAMMELAIAQEFGGDEEKAVKWYDTVAKEFPDSPARPKAAGAKLRLTSIGKSIPLKGKLVTGQVLDLERLKGKAVVIQYWATWCEPCKADMPLLKELRAKYAKDFDVVGVCLDNDKAAMAAFLKANDPKWPQLFEEGGLDSRFANEMGIQTLPTMILIDKQGKVVSRNIRAAELDAELKRIMK